jgi:biotin-[acetyl-CoA-carboxylase] ligase BirA-like protein
MNLCTDSPGCAEEFFSAPPGWTCGLQEDLPQEFRAIALRLLGGAPVAAAWTDLPRPWQCAIVVEHAVRSQFDVLVSALREGLDVPDGLICLAASGEGFHGQRGRPWAAVRGNLQISAFLSPDCHLNDIATGLTVLPAVSLVQTLDSIPGLEHRAGIRWVNDVIVDGSKLAGYLVHTQSSAGRVTGVVLGIGLNVEAVPSVAPTVFVPSVTALRDHVSHPYACSRSDILRRLLHSLALNYEQLVAGHAGELLDFYRERSVVLGRRVEVYTDLEGCAPGHSAAGTVSGIGDRLELILSGGAPPVSSGRVVMH